MMDNSGDTIYLPDGRRLLPVTEEYAAQVCRDIQLWFWSEHMGVWVISAWRPLDYRDGRIHPYEWMAANRAIEIDHDKEEYEPECQ